MFGTAFGFVGEESEKQMVSPAYRSLVSSNRWQREEWSCRATGRSPDRRLATDYSRSEGKRRQCVIVSLASNARSNRLNRSSRSRRFGTTGTTGTTGTLLNSPQACFRQRRISLRPSRESLCKACRSMAPTVNNPRLRSARISGAVVKRLSRVESDGF